MGATVDRRITQMAYNNKLTIKRLVVQSIARGRVQFWFNHQEGGTIMTQIIHIRA